MGFALSPLSIVLLSVLLMQTASAAPHLGAGSTGSYNGDRLTVNGRPYPSKYIQHPQPLDEELDYEKLKELISSRQIRKIEELVEALPVQMKDSNYAVMYRSRSLQHSTPKHPRILSYTPTARLILSFGSGDRSLQGHDTIELVQFRDATSRFEFREIRFPENGPPQFSEADPRKCAACHQSHDRKNVDYRPNWEPYNIWPGALGAKDGGILGHSPIDPADQRLRPYDREFLKEQAQEPRILEDFLKLAADHPRYKHLGQLNMNAPVALSELLAILNFQRVARLMTENTAHYEKHKEAVTMLGRCGSIPSEIFSFYDGRVPPNKYFSYASGSLSDHITALFEGAGIDTADWSMDFGSRGRLALFQRFGIPPSDGRDVFAYAWAAVHGTQAAESCADLEKAALERWRAVKNEIETVPVTVQRTERKTPRQITAICLNCHDGDDGFAPEIPFGDSERLASALKRKATLSSRILKDEILYRTSDMATHGEQMPPTKRLSPEDRRTLAEYLEQLSR